MNCMTAYTVGKPCSLDVINTLHKMAESGDIDAQSLLGWEYYQPRYDTKPDVQGSD